MSQHPVTGYLIIVIADDVSENHQAAEPQSCDSRVSFFLSFPLTFHLEKFQTSEKLKDEYSNQPPSLQLLTLASFTLFSL